MRNRDTESVSAYLLFTHLSSDDDCGLSNNAVSELWGAYRGLAVPNTPNSKPRQKWFGRIKRVKVSLQDVGLVKGFLCRNVNA